MSQHPKNQTNRIIRDVVNGYSSFTANRREFFVKHLTCADDAEIDRVYFEKIQHARSFGIPDIEQRYKQILADGVWTEKKEVSLSEQQYYVDNLIKGKSKLIIPSQREARDELIAAESKKLHALASEKKSLLGVTAEQYADEQSNNYYIYYSLYDDKNLLNHPFTYEQFVNLDESDLSSIIIGYNEIVTIFSLKQIKEAALSHQFQNPFSLCEKPAEYLGKPASLFTHYQTTLISYGVLYKNILSTHSDKIPLDVKDNPDALENWYESTNNLQKVTDRQKNDGNLRLFGANAQDLDKMGVDRSAMDRHARELLQKGTISTMDKMKQEGY